MGAHSKFLQLTNGFRFVVTREEYPKGILIFSCPINSFTVGRSTLAPYGTIYRVSLVELILTSSNVVVNIIHRYTSNPHFSGNSWALETLHAIDWPCNL